MSVSKNFRHTTFQNEGVFCFLNSEIDLWWPFEPMVEAFEVIITIHPGLMGMYCSEYLAIRSGSKAGTDHL